jgi:hypothetical protein
MQILQKSDITFQLKTKLKDIFLNPTMEVKEGMAVYGRESDKSLNYKENGTDIFVSSAGEYESQDIFFTGKKIKGSDTVIYLINAEGISFGLVSFVSKSSDIDLEFFEMIDVLFVHVNNGTDSLESKDAHDMIEKISPKMAVVFGFGDSLEEVKKNIPNMKVVEKNMKIEKSDLERIENTELYYFE